jgi:hypothetical protein
VRKGGEEREEGKDRERSLLALLPLLFPHSPLSLPGTLAHDGPGAGVGGEEGVERLP